MLAYFLYYFRDRTCVNILERFFNELDLNVKKIIGLKLFTLMVVDKSLKYVERVYSSNIKVYPLLGTKPIPKNEWTKKVVLNKKNFLGKDMKTIKKLFFSLRKKNGLGEGDIKLVGILALWTGLNYLPYLIILASLFAILHVIINKYILQNSKDILSIQSPYGSYLVFSFLCMIYLINL